MSDLSSSLRFAGSLNTNMRKTLVNIILFPRLHFFGCSFAPLANIANQTADDISIVKIVLRFYFIVLKTVSTFCEYSAADLVKQLFDDKNTLCSLSFKNGSHINCFSTFRGRLSISEAEKELYNVKVDKIQAFKDWIPYNIGWFASQFNYN